MINEIAVLETFDFAVARQTAVQTVAEPIHRKADIRQPEEIFVNIRQPIADGDDDSPEEAKRSQEVRVHPLWHVDAKPTQYRPLPRSEQDIVDARVGYLRHVLHEQMDGKENALTSFWACS